MRKNKFLENGQRTTDNLFQLCFNCPLSVVCRLLSVVCCLLTIITFSCQVPEEGCTDLAASNFDVTALKTCTGCCTYPTMKISTGYYWDADFFNFNTKYFIGKDSTHQDSILILSAQMFISEIFLTSPTTSKPVTVTDSIPFYRDADTIMKPNYYALIGKNNGFNYSLGHFTSFGQYNGIQFKIGVDQEVNKTKPIKMPSSSPFSLKSDTINSNYDSLTHSYIFHRLIFVSGVGHKDTTRLNFETSTNFSTACNLNFISGFDANIPLKIDYKQLLTGVSVKDDTAKMKLQIIANYPYAFKVQ